MPFASSIWYFLLPDHHAQPTGGNVYNRHLMQALDNRGICTVVLLPDVDLRQAVRVDRDVLVVDSLFLDLLEPDQLELIREASSFFLLHYLPSFAENGSVGLSERERTVLACFDGIITTSTYSKTRIESSLGSKAVIALEPVVEVKVRQTVWVVAKVKALMVANLTRNKGVLEFLEQLAGRVGGDIPFRLSIVGRHDMEPDYADRCRQCIWDSGLDSKVTLVGGVPHREIHRWYQRHNLFLSVSVFESFGMAIQEARAFGLPLLVLNRGHAGMHVEYGVNGYAYETLEDLVEGLLRLAARPEQFLNLQASARRTIPPGRTWDQVAEKLVRFVGLAEH